MRIEILFHFVFHNTNHENRRIAQLKGKGAHVSIAVEQQQADAPLSMKPEASVEHVGAVITASSLRRYVNFYFTNVPDMIPYYYVKEGLEVCDILDN